MSRMSDSIGSDHGCCCCATQAFICVPGGLLGLWVQGQPVPAGLTAAQMLLIVLGAGVLGFVGQVISRPKPEPGANRPHERPVSPGPI